MQRYFSNQLVDQEFLLSNDDWHHIKTVMRLQAGDKIEVVYKQELHLACLENVNKVLKARDEKNLGKVGECIPEITLCIPLVKEEKMDFIIQKATELGVRKIIPLKLERCLVKLDETRALKRVSRWQKIAKEASEQSKRTTIPQISSIQRITDLPDEGLKLICSTSEDRVNLHNLLQSHKTCDRIVVVIGPEGGLTKEEEQVLCDMEFQRVSLGNRILRVETVPIFFLSVINYEYME